MKKLMLLDALSEKGVEPKVHFRWMIRRDMAGVLQVEQQSFDYSWTEEDFLRCMRHRHCIGMVTEAEDKITGFCMYYLLRKSFLISNIAVRPEFQRKGIGKYMVKTLIEKAAKREVARPLKVLLPTSCRKAEPFFKKNGAQILLTDLKGSRFSKLVFEPMAKKHVSQVQEIEDYHLPTLEPRNIERIIATNSQYGIVAVDALNDTVLGYSLYHQDANGIRLGSYSIVVDSDHQRNGLGTKLWQEIVKLGQPINVEEVFFHSRDQVAFIKSLKVAWAQVLPEDDPDPEFEVEAITDDDD